MIGALQACRTHEKEQALFYRALALLAEERDELELAERLHGLHADEQHHVSRISVRLLELGVVLPDLRDIRSAPASLADWEPVARGREHAEIQRYEALLAGDLDAGTRALITETLQTERHHAAELGGKWTLA